MTTETTIREEARIDGEIAAAGQAWATAEMQTRNAATAVRIAAGDRQTGRGSERQWGMAFEAALAAATPATVAAYEAALATEATARAAFLAADAQYVGWSRFYLVKNNGGHIHRDTNCTTCFRTTQFGWLTDLSGLTEAEAVEAYGAILCTVCYPTAPTEWTGGEAKATIAEREARAAERAATKAAKAERAAARAATQLCTETPAKP